jgi:DNA-nicking Smr family endonuclease
MDNAGEEPTVVPIEAELDLHSFLPRDVASIVDAYLRAAAEAGLRDVRLVHGRGRGVQRGIVQAVLAAHPLVERFHDDPRAHLGATIARIRTGTGRGEG